MKISYAITVCNEYDEIQRLVSFLLENKRPEDEIVILYDETNGDERVFNYLEEMKRPKLYISKKDFNGDFAEWKNHLTELCSSEYIFQLDADELPHPHLIRTLPLIISNNPKNELFLIARVNTVEGLTDEYITKWRWKVNDKGWVNYPDFQTRLWKKENRIRWVGKVHERLTNFRTYTNLPEDEIYSIYHPKHIDRQVKQNDYYDKLMKNE